MKTIEMLNPKEGLLEVYGKFPEIAKVFVPLFETVMRNENTQLTVAKRELITLYVSVLNKCDYCIKIHSESSRALGINEKRINEFVTTKSIENVDEKYKPIFELVHKMVTDVKSITKVDYDKAKEKGWDDKTLVSLASVVGAYHMTNIFCSSLGFEVDEKGAKQTGGFLAKGGYTPVLKMLNIN